MLLLRAVSSDSTASLVRRSTSFQSPAVTAFSACSMFRPAIAAALQPAASASCAGDSRSHCISAPVASSHRPAATCSRATCSNARAHRICTSGGRTRTRSASDSAFNRRIRDYRRVPVSVRPPASRAMVEDAMIAAKSVLFLFLSRAMRCRVLGASPPRVQSDSNRDRRREYRHAC